MPLYEYDCGACHHAFETLVRGSEAPKCPACGSADLERRLSSFAVSSDATRQSARRSGHAHQTKSDRDRRVAEREEREHHEH